MIKNKIIQFSLLILAVILFFFTYYSKNNEKKLANTDKNTTIKNTNSLGKETSNMLEDVNYKGTDNRGTSFDLNASLAEVYYDKPNLSNMKEVNAIIRMNDGRKIYIKSDICVYDRTTNDAKFEGNVFVTESSNKITSDNLDLIMSENLITIYNNVKYNGEKGFLIADKIDINILTNESNILMFDKQKRVKAKYSN